MENRTPALDILPGGCYNEKQMGRAPQGVRQTGREGAGGMKVAVVMDSFKGSMSSMQAGQAAKRGILRADPDAQVQISPVADGGEGTMQALVEGCGGSYRSVSLCGPLGEARCAQYGVLRDGTAVIEMSQAAGLPLVPPQKRNPLYTTTYGVGQLIRDAVESGCRRFLIGIGGSATNDAGAGMLQALGYSLTDAAGCPIPLGARGLEGLQQICCVGALPQLKECSFSVACDVTNPLCGEQGCSAAFGPQKGATPQMVAQMDRWIAHYAQLAQVCCPNADPDAPGSGAAGGLGFTLRAFLGAQLLPGIQVVLGMLGLETVFAHSDLILTGEGRLDGQTAMGKVPCGVAALAHRYGKPVVALAGSVAPEGEGAAAPDRVDASFAIVRGPAELAQAMRPECAQENMERTAEQVIRLWRLVQKQPQ